MKTFKCRRTFLSRSCPYHGLLETHCPLLPSISLLLIPNSVPFLPLLSLLCTPITPTQPLLRSPFQHLLPSFSVLIITHFYIPQVGSAYSSSHIFLSTQTTSVSVPPHPSGYHPFKKRSEHPLIHSLHLANPPSRVANLESKGLIFKTLTSDTTRN